MPAWDTYKEEATERGSLALEVYTVISTPCSEMEKIKELLPQHLAYQAELEQKNLLMLAGPLSDESGEQMEGVGQIIFRAASFTEARELCDADPMHFKGGRSYTLRRWLINEGSIQLNVQLSAQKVTL